MEDEQHQRESQRKAKSGAQSTPAWMALTGMAARCGLNDHGDDENSEASATANQTEEKIILSCCHMVNER